MLKSDLDGALMPGSRSFRWRLNVCDVTLKPGPRGIVTYSNSSSGNGGGLMATWSIPFIHDHGSLLARSG
jgi:hypothetical protein